MPGRSMGHVSARINLRLTSTLEEQRHVLKSLS